MLRAFSASNGSANLRPSELVALGLAESRQSYVRGVALSREPPKLQQPQPLLAAWDRDRALLPSCDTRCWRAKLGMRHADLLREATAGIAKPFFDCVRKPGLGFSRKRPFSTDKSDCIRNGLRASLVTFLDLKMKVFGSQKPVCKSYRPKTGDFSDFNFCVLFYCIVFRVGFHPEMGVRFRMKSCPKMASGFGFPFFFFRTLLLSSFWISRGHKCRPFPPVLAFNFYRA